MLQRSSEQRRIGARYLGHGAHENLCGAISWFTFLLQSECYTPAKNSRAPFRGLLFGALCADAERKAKMIAYSSAQTFSRPVSNTVGRAPRSAVCEIIDIL
jgi:hypothetical protein